MPRRNGAVRHSVSDSFLETLPPRGGPAIAARPAACCLPPGARPLWHHAPPGAPGRQPSPSPPGIPCTMVVFFCFTHRSPHPSPCSTSAARAWRQPGARHRSHGSPWSFLVKELIQVSSDSIFPPLLDKQNREMPLTRKRSSNHLVFASRSLPVTVETTPLPPTCCQCLDCSYLLLIKLASPLLFCYPIQSRYVLQTPC